MIARQAIPQPVPSNRVHARARDAVRRRVRRTRLNGYAVLARISVAVAMMLVPVMIYVLLMGNLTALNFRLAQASLQAAALQDETIQLDDRIAQLQSRDRLADLAARLHMHDPLQMYAVVEVPRPVVAPPSNGVAFLGTFFHH